MDLKLGAAIVAALFALTPAAEARDEAPSTPHRAAAATKKQMAQVANLRRGITAKREETWRWQRTALLHPIRSNYSEERTTSVAYLQWVRRLWARRTVLARAQAQHPPHKAQWLCIQSGIKGGRWSLSLKYLGGGMRVGHGEGSWTTDGLTYDGGLQMNIGFQRTYGRQLLSSKGTANRWNAYEQMWAAEQAYRSRGFSPWPQTARDCGLL